MPKKSRMVLNSPRLIISIKYITGDFECALINTNRPKPTTVLHINTMVNELCILVAIHCPSRANDYSVLKSVHIIFHSLCLATDDPVAYFLDHIDNQTDTKVESNNTACALGDLVSTSSTSDTHQVGK